MEATHENFPYNKYESIVRDKDIGTCRLIDIAISGNINVIR
jgi:hypothetical protein